MVTLLSAFCLILFGVLITINAERNHWKKQCELLQQEKEDQPVKQPKPEPKPEPKPKPKADNREYFLLNRDDKCKQSDSLVDWFASSDL